MAADGKKGDGHLPGLRGAASGREACSARAMPTDPVLPVLGLSRGHGEAFQHRSDLATPWFNKHANDRQAQYQAQGRKNDSP